MKYSYIIILLILFICNDTNSQTAGLNFTVGIPSGEFSESMTKTGYGGSLHFTFWNTGSSMPASLGLNVGYITFGSETRNTRISSDIPDVTVDVDRSYNLANFHLLVQISPFDGPFLPYLDALLGGSYLYTETKIESEISGDDVASSVNFDDFAWSYGGGGGFLIKLVDQLGNENEDEKVKLGSLYLDLKARYLFGSRAEYLTPGSVRIDNGRVLYDVSKSKTDLLTLQLGVVISLR